MAANSTNSFDRAFPRRDLYRGSARVAMLWSIPASLLLAAVVLDLYLIADLLESRGSLSLTAEQLKTFKDNSGIDLAVDVTKDGGLCAFVFRTSDTPLGPAVATVYRNVPWLQSNTTALAVLVLSAVLFGLLRSMILSRMNQLSARAGFDIVNRLRRTLHRQALRLGTSDFKANAGEEALELFSTDTERLRQTVADRISRLARFSLESAVLLLVALSIEWRLALQCLIPLGFCWFLFQRAQLRVAASGRLNESRAASQLQILGEGFRKARLVLGYGMENFEHGQFQTHLNAYRDNAMAVESDRRWYRWTCRALLLLSAAIVLFFIGMKVLGSIDVPRGLSFAAAILLILTMGMMYVPLSGLAGLEHRKSEASGSADRIYRYLNRIPEVGQAVGAKFLQPLSRSVQFENVGYESAGTVLLDGINLKLNAGEITAIVSHDRLESRAMAYLLTRFIEPHKGRILFDGEDIAWATLESLRAETAYVGGADPFFTGTVLQNITCGNAEVSLTDATEAAKTTHAHNFILKLPGGYETMIGEHGTQLDVGQGFRLGLARAMLRKPELLIIEEPRETLDVDTKSMLDDAYQRIIRGRTVVFLPSRLSTLKRADRIVLLNRGKVEAVGPHSELVKSSPLYRHWEYLNFNEFRNSAETA